MHQSIRHLSILTDAILSEVVVPLISSGATGVIQDCTFGGGGHTSAILDLISKHQALDRLSVVSLDQDPDALARGQENFAHWINAKKLTLVHTPFGDYRHPEPLAGLIADLGISSDQLDDPTRGFSFNSEAALDMRMNAKAGFTAYQILQQSTEKDLADWIFQYGEERLSRVIAKAIVEARRAKQLPKTGQELGELIKRCVPASYRHGRIHPATRTFQALRIVVNQELEQLDLLLANGILNLKAGGRAGIISFHSLEDRRVKQRYRELAQSDSSGFRLVTKKPIEPDTQEVERNSRARSAKFRVIERL